MGRVLVTGIGRSGTAYMARLLTAAGLSCGHERLYNGATVAAPSWAGHAAEASWFAVPWLGDLGKDVEVVHLVRHPVRWLASWAFTTWRPSRRHGPTTKYLARHTGVAWGSHAERDVLAAAMRLWVTWNGLVGDRCQRLRIEDVDEDVLRALLSRAGVATSGARQALAKVPHNVNARPHPALRWADCKHKPSAGLFADLARAYGYALGDNGGVSAGPTAAAGACCREKHDGGRR